MISQIEPPNYTKLLKKVTNNVIYSNLTYCTSVE